MFTGGALLSIFTSFSDGTIVYKILLLFLEESHFLLQLLAITFRLYGYLDSDIMRRLVLKGILMAIKQMFNLYYESIDNCIIS